MYILGANMYILGAHMSILGANMSISWAIISILGANMSILSANMYISGANMYKSVPFEKVQPQWQLLYLFFWECKVINVPYVFNLETNKLETITLNRNQTCIGLKSPRWEFLLIISGVHHTHTTDVNGSLSEEMVILFSFESHDLCTVGGADL